VRQDLDCGSAENMGKMLCGVCRKGVGSNTINAINAILGYIESVVMYLVNCRMWLFFDVRGVLMGTCFEIHFTSVTAR